MPFSPETAQEAAGLLVPWRPRGLRHFSSHDIYIRLINDQGNFLEEQINIINILRNLYEIGTSNIGNPEGGTNIFHGGHVIVLDGGDVYQRLEQLCVGNAVPGGQRGQGRNLPSSHYRNVGIVTSQYEVRLPVTWQQNWGAILFGLDGNDDSWFQLEAHSGTLGTGARRVLRYVSDVAMHSFDYMQYWFSGMQVGPCGYSGYTELAPLRINL